MNKKFVALFLAAALLLSGCQLAVADTDAHTGPDQLVGVYLTREPIDLFDMDSFLQDNIGAILGGSDVQAAESDKYTGRLYAELVSDAYTDPNGNEQISYSYAFPDVEGLMLCYFLIKPDGAEDLAYRSSNASSGICDIALGCKSIDNGEEITMSGTIYFQSNYPNDIFLYQNPVYQTPDGEVYLMAGSGIHYSVDLGGAFSVALNEELTYSNTDGTEQTYRCDINISADRVELCDRIVLIQMDAEHQELSRSEYVPGQLPEELVPEAQAAYILIEEHHSNTVSYAMNQPGDDPVSAFYPMADGICIPDYIRIIWPK